LKFWTLFSLLATASFSFALVLGLKKVMIVTWTDESCTGIGGKILGHSQVIGTHEDGSLFEATVTNCEVTLKPKPKPKAGASSAPSQMSNLTTFSTILETSGLSSEVDSAQDVTILAPTDEAFKKLSQRQVEQLTKNRAAAAAFVSRHILLGTRVEFGSGLKIRSTSVAKGRDGAERRIEVKPGRMTVGGAGVVALEIPTDNGVMVMLDSIVEEKR